MKFRIGKKAIVIVDDLIALAILGAVIGAIIIIPAIALKIHIINLIQFENKYNTADLAMLALLSLKNEGKEMPQILADYVTSDIPSDISFVSTDLEKIIPSKCFSLTTGSLNTRAPTRLISIKPYITDCSPDTSTKTKIPVPYNPEKLSETLELKIS